MDLVTNDRYSETDFTIFYDSIFEINTQYDWIVEGPHVLHAIEVIFRTNVRLALNENVIQWRLACRPFKKNLMQVSRTRNSYKVLARLSPALVAK